MRAPPHRPIGAYLHGRSTGKNATDRTRYGTTRISTTSFYTHHMQSLSAAAVVFDARNIRRQLTYLKQKVFSDARQGPASA